MCMFKIISLGTYKFCIIIYRPYSKYQSQKLMNLAIFSSRCAKFILNLQNLFTSIQNEYHNFLQSQTKE